MASIGRVRSAVTVGLRQSSLRGPVPRVPRPPVDRARVASRVRVPACAWLARDRAALGAGARVEPLDVHAVRAQGHVRDAARLAGGGRADGAGVGEGGHVPLLFVHSTHQPAEHGMRCGHTW